MAFTVELERPASCGKRVAEIPEFPGCPVVEATDEAALAKVEALAFGIFADPLRDRHTRSGASGAAWLLVTADEQSELPVLDGKPIPVLSPARYARVPHAWLEAAEESPRPVAVPGHPAASRTATT